MSGRFLTQRILAQAWARTREGEQIRARCPASWALSATVRMAVYVRATCPVTADQPKRGWAFAGVTCSTESGGDADAEDGQGAPAVAQTAGRLATGAATL